MTRRGATISLALAAVAAALACCLGAADAIAVPPAGGEYTLDLPGLGDLSHTRGQAIDGGGGTAHQVLQAGVAGENDAPSSDLASTGDALGAIPIPLVAIIALAGCAVAIVARRYRLRAR